MNTRLKRRLMGRRDTTDHSGEISAQATERHYRPEDVAELWQMDVSTVRKMFRDVPGVLKHGDQRYKTIRIPQSILDRYHREKAK